MNVGFPIHSIRPHVACNLMLVDNILLNHKPNVSPLVAMSSRHICMCVICASWCVIGPHFCQSVANIWMIGLVGNNYD